MGGLCHCIVAGAHLGNGRSCRTVTMAAPLLLTSGPAMYEVELHSHFVVFVCARGMYTTGQSGLNQTMSLCCTWEWGEAWYVEGVYAVVSWGCISNVCGGGVCRDRLG